MNCFVLVLAGVVSILTGLIRSPVQGTAGTGVAGLVRLAGEVGDKLSEDEWREIFLALKEAATSSVPGFMKVLRTMDDINVPGLFRSYSDIDLSSDHGFTNDDLEDDNLQTASYLVSRMKSHIAMQLLIIQVATDLYRLHLGSFSVGNISILLEIFSLIASHAYQLNSETILHKKLQKVCSVLELTAPPLVHFENDSYKNYLSFLQNALVDNPSLSGEMNIEAQLVGVCESIFQIYLNCADLHSAEQRPADEPVLHWILPLGTAKKEELATRSDLAMSALQVLNSLEKVSFRRHRSRLFPLLVDLVRSKHASGEVRFVLSNIFQSCIGPIVMQQ